MLDKTTLPNLNNLLDTNSDWVWHSEGRLQQLGIFPNRLAYSETQATYCLIATQSKKGGDYALGKAGADFLTRAQRTGRKDGKPVNHCMVVLVSNDGKLISQTTIEQTMDRIVRQKIHLEEGRWGPFWWLTPDYSGKFNDQDDELNAESR